jgi:hypothetical protein
MIALIAAAATRAGLAVVSADSVGCALLYEHRDDGGRWRQRIPSARVVGGANARHLRGAVAPSTP